MARLFDDANTQHAGITNTLGGLQDPLTMACWFYSDDATINQALMTLTNTGGTSGGYLLRAMGATAGDPILATKQNDAGAGASATSTTGYSTNTWHHACAVFASNTSRTVYIDGGSSATDTTNITDPTPDVFNIGAMQNSAGYQQHMSGRIAYAAIWSTTLGAASVARLAAGADPRIVAPQALIAYWQLIGRNSPEIDIVGGYDLTLSASAPTAADGPRIYMPRRRRIWVPAAGSSSALLAGSSSALLAGAAVAASDVSVEGVGQAAFDGASTVSVALASDGVSAGSFPGQGEGTAAGSLLCAGTSVASFSSAQAVAQNLDGWKPRAKRKTSSRDDQDLMVLIALAAPILFDEAA